LLATLDGETLHQMRVSLRRLRSALRLFQPLTSPQLALEAGLRDLSGALGAARDLDVLLDKARAHVATLPPESAGSLDPLLARFPAQRQALALRAATDGMRFDMDAVAKRLAALDALMPGSALGYYEAGRFLALARQYAEAAATLFALVQRAGPGVVRSVARRGTTRRRPLPMTTTSAPLRHV
jgi:hypothetical protein